MISGGAALGTELGTSLDGMGGQGKPGTGVKSLNMRNALTVTAVVTVARVSADVVRLSVGE